MSLDDQHAFTPEQSFRYRPLDVEEGEEIRLICLQPGSYQDPIRCEIFHASFDLEIMYGALSYTWADENGDASLSESVKCAYSDEMEYRSLSVTRNCAAALRRIRGSSQEKILWVDAMAIDQSNFLERSHQVGVMDQIYSKASLVVVYLGEEPLGLTEPGLWLDDRRRRIALEKLFSRPWVSRVWVIQEFALARKAMLVMGPESCVLDEALFSRIRGRARVYKLRVPGPLAWDPLVGRTDGTLALLDMARNCHATEPRDKVYGIMGLASDSFRAALKVDYSLSMEEILLRTAEAIIIAEGLDILAYASSSSDRKLLDTGLPSWVPDWTQPVSGNTIRPQLELIKYSSLVCLWDDKPGITPPVTIPPEWLTRSESFPFLTVQAHMIGKIDDTGRDLDAPDNAWPTCKEFGSHLHRLLDEGLHPNDWPFHFRWLLDPDEKIHDFTRELLHDIAADLWTFHTELSREDDDARVFRAGHLPAVSSAAFRKDDSVWAVDGCRRFLILRSVDSDAENYTIMGSCYLFGMNHFDCYEISGSGITQRWDFNPFRRMADRYKRTIKIY